MVVDDDQLYVVQNFWVVEPERLDRKIDAIVVVVRRHADGQRGLKGPTWCRRLNWIGLGWNRDRHRWRAFGKNRHKLTQFGCRKLLLDR